MYLTTRSTHPKDFEACFNLLHNGFVFTKTKTVKALGALWDHTLREHNALSRVIEDQERPEGKKIVGLGFSVCATDDFMQELRANPAPYPALQVLRLLKQGRKPFLSRPEMARLNAGEGLNCLTLTYGWNRRLPEQDRGQLRLKLMEAFLMAHQGWRWKEFIQEVYGAESKADMEGIGMNLLGNYRESTLLARTPASSRPYLFGIRRNSRKFLDGDFLFAQFFNYTPPRFGFSAGEKDMLALTLEGKIDLEIAKSLHLSLWTVKKRWQGVYRKVDRRDPTLLKPGPSASTGPKGSKDLQRRRRLMEYLRHHMEEIRPFFHSRHKS